MNFECIGTDNFSLDHDQEPKLIAVINDFVTLNCADM
jgi:hypothetical protein